MNGPVAIKHTSLESITKSLLDPFNVEFFIMDGRAGLQHLHFKQSNQL